MDEERRILLLISDPWQFGTEVGVGPFYGVVQARRGDDLAVRLDRPLRFRDLTVVGLVITPRHAEAKDAWDALPVDPVAISAIPFTAPPLKGETVFEAADRWRGWGLAGTVQFIPHNATGT